MGDWFRLLVMKLFTKELPQSQKIRKLNQTQTLSFNRLYRRYGEREKVFSVLSVVIS